MDPSYCSPNPPSADLYEMGEKQLQSTVSAMLMAMNKLVPELPIPYPFVIMSSNRIVIIEATVSWSTIKIALPAPMASKGPYIPDHV